MAREQEANQPNNRTIARVSAKAREYVSEVLNFGFHNCNSPGFTARLEREFAERFGMTFGIAHANGTCTMQSALMAADIGVGDEVIVPTHTVFSTAVAALHINAVPILADVDPDTWTISVEDLARLISPRTRAIIPVAICGLSADMDPIMELAKEHDLVVIEDNAQCCVGYYKGRIVGSMGDFASFSFQASKTLTCGDGGILICKDEELATKARKAATLGYSALSAKPGSTAIPEELRCHPSFARFGTVGWNQRLPEVACAVAVAELERLDELVEMRTLSAKCFEQVVKNCDWLVPQKTPKDYVNSCWTYSARIVDDGLDWAEFRKKFVELGGDGFYSPPLPLHLEPVFTSLSEAVQKRPERYPHFAGYFPDYRQWRCPIWEKIQPRIIQLKTNYFDTDSAQRQADILEKTIRYFS